MKKKKSKDQKQDIVLIWIAIVLMFGFVMCSLNALVFVEKLPEKFYMWDDYYFDYYILYYLTLVVFAIAANGSLILIIKMGSWYERKWDPPKKSILY